MTQRFPPLAPQEPISRSAAQLLQSLPLGKLFVILLIALALLLA